LHAERAVAAYGHAVVVARLARAMSELADAQKSLEDATAQEEVLEASRAKLERNADELEERLRGARERVLPAASAPATPEREAARLVAARSLATQARLICAAARLIAPEAAGLASADDEVTRLEDRLAKSPRPAPIDDAARARTRCLDVLTLTRRGTGDDGGATDALLAELSAAGGWEPSRDERGVTVTLHDAFRAADLSGAVADRLKELGRVAAAHPHFAVQLVVHDASAPVSGDTADAKRAEAAVQALVGGGAVSSRVRAELAGASAPIVDPANANGRARNERLEVVFVGNGR
jgi:flagellar motor protein MotB